MYLNLLKNAKGKYIYFLEDDDLLLPPFLKGIKSLINEDIDLGYFNYFDYKGLSLEFKDSETQNFQKFCNTYNHYKNFQLSRFITKKSIITKFPLGNNVLNDWVLFKSLTPKTFKTYKYLIYKQGIPRISMKPYNQGFYECLTPEFIDLK